MKSVMHSLVTCGLGFTMGYIAAFPSDDRSMLQALIFWLAMVFTAFWIQLEPAITGRSRS